MIFTLGSDEACGLLGAAPGEQGNLIDTTATNRTASLSSDFHVRSHPRFHLRKNNNSNEKSYDGKTPLDESILFLYRSENSG